MPTFSDPIIAPAFLGGMFAVNPFGVTFYVSNTTNPAEGQGSPGTTRQGRSPRSPFTTVAAAVAAAVSGRGDSIVIQRGTYTETVNFNKAGLTVRGAVSAGYPDHVILAGVTTVNASGITFADMEFFSNSATAYCVRLGNTTEVDSIWFERCSFASDGTTEPEGAVAIHGGNNIVFRGCYIIDTTYGIRFTTGLISDNPSHVSIVGCEFLENTTADISDIGSDTGTGLSGFEGVAAKGVRNFVLADSVFGAGITTPTDFINIGGTSNGVITGCRFASATHASATITIPSGILYAVNSAEEGLTGTFASNIGTSGRPD